MRRASIVLSIVMSLLLFAGCGSSINGFRQENSSVYKRPVPVAVEENEQPNAPKSPREGLAASSGEVMSTGSVTIQLYFAEVASVVDGTPGPFGYVTPVPRRLQDEKADLHAAVVALIHGPQEGDGAVEAVLPNTVMLLDSRIEDGIAYLDFDKALYDSRGGSLGGILFMQGIVLTAAQFDQVNGVCVTVEGEPWTDGHFIWDLPVTAEGLLGWSASETH